MDSREVVRSREREAWNLRLQGLSQEAIADQLGVSQSGICRILTRVEKRLAKEFTEHAAQIKARQAAMLERVTTEALTAWERSKEDAETVRTSVKWVIPRDGSDPYQVTDESREVKGQAGDSALLAQARGALADIRAVWGLDAPKKADVTSGGEPISGELVRVQAVLLAALGPFPEALEAAAAALEAVDAGA